MSEATVTISLAEFDNLRDDLKDAADFKALTCRIYMKVFQTSLEESEKRLRQIEDVENEHAYRKSVGIL